MQINDVINGTWRSGLPRFYMQLQRTYWKHTENCPRRHKLPRFPRILLEISRILSGYKHSHSSISRSWHLKVAQSSGAEKAEKVVCPLDHWTNWSARKRWDVVWDTCLFYVCWFCCTVGPISENPDLSFLHCVSRTNHKTTWSPAAATSAGALGKRIFATGRMANVSICSQLLQRVIAIDAHGFIGKFLPDELWQLCRSSRDPVYRVYRCLVDLRTLQQTKTNYTSKSWWSWSRVSDKNVKAALWIIESTKNSELCELLYSCYSSVLLA